MAPYAESKGVPAPELAALMGVEEHWEASVPVAQPSIRKKATQVYPPNRRMKRLQ